MVTDRCIEDYGSGLNYNRKQWNALLDGVMNQKIKTTAITHKDRFIRFGYDCSCRLYGLSKYKKQIQGDDDIVKELQNRNKSNRTTKD